MNELNQSLGSTMNPYQSDAELSGGKRIDPNSVVISSRRRSIDTYSSDTNYLDIQKNNNNMRVMIQLGDDPSSQRDKHRRKEENSQMMLMKLYQINSDEEIPMIENEQIKEQLKLKLPYLDMHNDNSIQKLNTNSVNYLSIPFVNANLNIQRNPSNKAFVGQPLNGSKKKHIVQKNSMLQPVYKQIGSSFILDNKDRFGQPYVRKTYETSTPGPGYYNMYETIRKERELKNISSQMMIPKGRYIMLRQRNLTLENTKKRLDLSHLRSLNNNSQLDFNNYSQLSQVLK